ncbi:VOC family protein [Deinococcus multiflagellatus]|uniref:VOC family protein n=1 Tax=Deinococcus multiflagellatus TaxID=1656887 RepID=A0ABW1ZJ25_9DEIO|nr:VOC family protein [Deinococcus multiflagellatus]MBZ9712413.1 VOC family protein [Deinococcus multiflagellatus]
MSQLVPALMSEGRAAEARVLSFSLFPGARELARQDSGPDGPGAPGTIMTAEVELAGQRLRMADSPVAHALTFTPFLSLFVDGLTAADFGRVFTGLSEAGEVLMPTGNDGFSTHFAWRNDRFGASWPLNVP